MRGIARKHDAQPASPDDHFAISCGAGDEYYAVFLQCGERMKYTGLILAQQGSRRILGIACRLVSHHARAHVLKTLIRAEALPVMKLHSISRRT